MILLFEFTKCITVSTRTLIGTHKTFKWDRIGARLFACFMVYQVKKLKVTKIILKYRYRRPCDESVCTLRRRRGIKSCKIYISETWLDDSVFDSELSILNYNIYRRDRNRHGGGVCLYIRSDIAFNTREDLQHQDLESLWIELLLPKTKPILLAAIYRPPKQNDFYTILEELCMNSTHFSKYDTFIIGDFNSDVPTINTYHSSLKHLMNMFDIKQSITDFTRICKTSSTHRSCFNL